MATINKFEDIRSWQNARELVRMVYHAIKQNDFAKDFELRGQITDAAGSVMHNIAEGFDAGSDNEFIRFLGYARRSASETQSQLYIALDQGYLSEERFQEIYDKANLIKRQINALIAYLHTSRSKQVSESPTAYQIDLPNNLGQKHE